jgi:hypothetical protein
MGSIVRKRTIEQRLGNDALYGSGYDGTQVISGTTYLVRDMHYDNLTIGSAGTLVTNGFRVFVKNTLTITAGGKVGTFTNLPSGGGTLVGRVLDGPGLKQYVVGESAAGTQVPDNLLKDIEYVSNGWTIDPIGGFRRIEGADDGTAGANVAGSNAPALGTPGGPTAGTAGGLGEYAPANTPSAPAGQNGGKGNPGNPGNVGAQGGTGIGGAGGVGGGLVVIIARNIVKSGTGTATIASQGKAGDLGTTGSTGATGNDGTAGTAAPKLPAAFAGNYVPAGHNPSTTTPGTLNPPGFTPGTHVPEAHAPGQEQIVPGNVSYKADHNPGYNVSGHNVTYYHRTYNYYYGGLQYHAVARENPGNYYSYYVPGNPTGNYHAYHNPSSYTHNPSHYQAAYTNPGHYNPQTHNPATTTPGNAYNAYHNNEHNPEYKGGNAGAKGLKGSGGAGGTGVQGTTGKNGGLFIITDTDSSLSGIFTLTAYKTVIIVNN